MTSVRTLSTVVERQTLPFAAIEERFQVRAVDRVGDHIVVVVWVSARPPRAGYSGWQAFVCNAAGRVTQAPAAVEDEYRQTWITGLVAAIDRYSWRSAG